MLWEMIFLLHFALLSTSFSSLQATKSFCTVCNHRNFSLLLRLCPRTSRLSIVLWILNSYQTISLGFCGIRRLLSQPITAHYLILYHNWHYSGHVGYRRRPKCEIIVSFSNPLHYPAALLHIPRLWTFASLSVFADSNLCFSITRAAKLRVYVCSPNNCSKNRLNKR